MSCALRVMLQAMILFLVGSFRIQLCLCAPRHILLPKRQSPLQLLEMPYPLRTQLLVLPKFKRRLPGKPILRSCSSSSLPGLRRPTQISRLIFRQESQQKDRRPSSQGPRSRPLLCVHGRRRPPMRRNSLIRFRMDQALRMRWLQAPQAVFRTWGRVSHQVLAAAPHPMDRPRTQHPAAINLPAAPHPQPQPKPN